jgi:hypothetical protein
VRFCRILPNPKIARHSYEAHDLEHGPLIHEDLSASSPAFGKGVAEQTPAVSTGNLKQPVVRIPACTMIEVKLKQKGSKKITGRFGPVSDKGFEVQSAESGWFRAKRSRSQMSSR